MLNQFKMLYSILDKNMRRKLIKSFPIFLIFATFETIGVASVYPLLTYISSPNEIEKNLVMQKTIIIFQNFGANTEYQMVILLTSLTIFIILLSAGFRIFAYYYINRVNETLRYQLSMRMMKLYCDTKYINIIYSRSDEIIKTLNHDIDYLVQQVIKNIIMAIPQIFIIIGIAFVLILLYPAVTIVAVSLLACLYLLLYLVSNKYVSKLGQKFNNSVLRKNQLIFDYIKNIKLIKAYRKDTMFEGMYSNTMSENTELTAKYYSFVQMPVYLFEAIIMAIALTGLGFLHIHSSSGLMSVVPIIGLFFMSIYRIKPGLQMVFRIFTDVRNNTVLIGSIFQNINTFTANSQSGASSYPTHYGVNKLTTLEFKNIGFAFYQDDWIFREFNYRFESGEQYCIIGPSGSGKTTLVDMILQMITPTEGTIFVNGESVSNFDDGFGDTIARYVPQETHLLSGTIAQNVAFTLEDDINYNNVKKALWLAVLDETFDIENSLAWVNQDLTGAVSRLSGGQIQRIGIARALYDDNCSILILDEATSALDEQTEKELISRLQSTYNDKIVIHISHKHSIINSCKNIINMDHYKAQ